jgi:multidrug efflux pump subunit AcrA (membrane-fusion protein)
MYDSPTPVPHTHVPRTHVRRPAPPTLRAVAWPTLAAALLVLTGCSKAESTPTEKPTPVRVAAATEGPATPPIATTGTVASKDEIRLSFKLGGVIRRIAVEEGDEVKSAPRSSRRASSPTRPGATSSAASACTPTR